MAVQSSGTTAMKRGSGGTALTSNKRTEHLLISGKRSSVSHLKKKNKTRIIGEDVTSIDTSGNAEINTGSAALLKRNRRGRHHHGHHYHRYSRASNRLRGYSRPYHYGGHWGSHASPNARTHRLNNAAINPYIEGLIKTRDDISKMNPKFSKT